ncbi:MAG: prolipoprotein diacylglyceryl transferase [Acidobacteria bacterium]|nr:prolipoprotein diacylglyceryl transferase [Acidobacteriota bacterium]
MFPKLIQIGSFYIPTYGVLVTTGVILGLYLTLRLAAKTGFSKEEKEQTANLIIYTVIGGVLGSKLLLVLVDFHYYVAHPIELVQVLRSGGVFYGGLIGGMLTAAWLFHRYKLSFYRVADVAAPHIALGHAIGRLGCFSAGCCYGKACGLPIAVEFHSKFAHSIVGVPLNTPIYPTQLMSSISLFIIFLVLRFYFWPRRKFQGQMIWLYVLIYSAFRFGIEFFRGDADRGFVFHILSTSQFISAILFFAAIVMLYRLSRRHRAS